MWHQRFNRNFEATRILFVNKENNILYVQWILSKMAQGWRGEDKLFNKVNIFVFFVYKKYSRSFVKLRLNPGCHMDYWTLLDFYCVNYTDVCGRVRELFMHQKYLIYVLKMNGGLTGLERHEVMRTWVINERIKIFGWTIPLMLYILILSRVQSWL